MLSVWVGRLRVLGQCHPSGHCPHLSLSRCNPNSLQSTASFSLISWSMPSLLPHSLKLWQHQIYINAEMPVIVNSLLILWEVITPRSFQIKKTSAETGRLCSADRPIPAAHYSHEVHCTAISSSGTLNFQNFFTIDVAFLTLQTFIPSPLCLQNQLEYFVQSFLSCQLLFLGKMLGFETYFLNEKLKYHKGLQQPFDTSMI